MSESDPTRSVKTWIIVSRSSSCCRSPCFSLLAILVSQTTFDLNFLHPGNNQEIVVFAALSALIFLLFVALTFHTDAQFA